MKPYPKISQLRRVFRVSACVCRGMDSNLPGISTEARYTIRVCQKNNLSTTLACYDGYAGPGRLGTRFLTIKLFYSNDEEFQRTVTLRVLIGFQ